MEGLASTLSLTHLPAFEPTPLIWDAEHHDPILTKLLRPLPLRNSQVFFSFFPSLPLSDSSDIRAPPSPWLPWAMTKLSARCLPHGWISRYFLNTRFLEYFPQACYLLLRRSIFTCAPSGQCAIAPALFCGLN